MFVLGGSAFPNSRDEFASALEQGLKVFGSPRGIAQLDGSAFPHFEKLKIDLTGGRVLPDTRPSDGVGEKGSAVTITRFEVLAAPMQFEESGFHFHLSADDV